MKNLLVKTPYEFSFTSDLSLELCADVIDTITWDDKWMPQLATRLINSDDRSASYEISSYRISAQVGLKQHHLSDKVVINGSILYNSTSLTISIYFATFIGLLVLLSGNILGVLVVIFGTAFIVAAYFQHAENLQQKLYDVLHSHLK